MHNQKYKLTNVTEQKNELLQTEVGHFIFESLQRLSWSNIIR